MGKLITKLDLPSQFILSGWGNGDNNQTLNGLYSPVLVGGAITSYKLNTGDFYFVRTTSSWSIRRPDPQGGLTFIQWQIIYSPLASPKALPLNGYIRSLGQLPHGTISPVLLDTKNISIKKQNLTVSGYGIALVNGIYKLQNTLINGRNWYLHDSLLFNVRWNNSTSRWNLLSNQGVELSVATNSTNNPWEATWSNNVQVSLGSGGKISLKSSAIPLNTLNIRINNGPSNAPWGVGGSGPCGNDFQLLNNQNGIWSQGHLSCDFYVAWDNKYGTLPYRWRLYYNSDGRLDYAEHPTAGPEALPSKGWSNEMTITAI